MVSCINIKHFNIKIYKQEGKTNFLPARMRDLRGSDDELDSSSEAARRFLRPFVVETAGESAGPSEMARRVRSVDCKKECCSGGNGTLSRRLP